MFGLITRRRYEEELAAAKAEIQRQRRIAEAAVSRANTAEFNRGQVLRQLGEADAANRRLHGRNLELGERLAHHAEADPEYAAQLEQQVARLTAEQAAEKQRADQLQQRLDDALGLNDPAVLAGQNWQATREDVRKGVAS